MKKILSIGTMSGISNTCLFRNWALEEIADKVDVVNVAKKPVSLWYRVAHHLFLYGLPVKLPDRSKANKQIISLMNENEYNIIWIDKGITINKKTLKKIRKTQPNVNIISYSPDNMALRHNQSQNYLESIPLYDIHFTTKSYILGDMKKLGAKKVYFVQNSYESKFNYPHDVTTDDIKRLGCDVGFVGSWEKERMESILYLTRNGVKVRVFGDKKWSVCKNDNPNLIIEDHGLFNEDYSKSFRCFKISLCFLRKINYDQQTSRTMEIPACGGFMLAERTVEHLQLFEEGKEAEFFDSNEELLEKCKYYLEHEEERKNIVNGGIRRCKESGYSNVDTINHLLKLVVEENKVL
ncbi:glycosyl transferases group 1 family protein [[Clostridium] bifermentans ATCC 19299]|uniref:CgeB family protein n=1 Tax=Paraclostridium bifermentans TaxID=1490 RepID=UPI00038D37C1|nr:glycosyltransferase [Paraclostridium bifermentans]EQK45819.1 glycosyl transferases group 1 family protein [[Clostridium] bifermentans ATCC 19299] [Paraclostridium bifermentans ATCC 19299]